MNRPSKRDPFRSSGKYDHDRDKRGDGAMRRSCQVIWLLGILNALEQGERLHVRQLAARLQAHRETIYRDFRAFQVMWFPVASDIQRITTRPRLNTHLSANVVPISSSAEEFLTLDFTASPTDHLSGTASLRRSPHLACPLERPKRFAEVIIRFAKAHLERWQC